MKQTNLPKFDKQSLENKVIYQGYNRIAGGDEAGRGPWAGPVCAAIVILPRDVIIKGLDDSKKLSRLQRKNLFKQITQIAEGIGIGWASPEEIDKYNILEATKLAFKRAFEQLSPTPDFILLDFIKLPWLTIPSLSFPKGESLSNSIAAASIVAKESRDLLMEQMEEKYPGYGFGKHKGYGTVEHKNALIRLGPCPIHRMSFKPVRKILNNENNYQHTFT